MENKKLANIELGDMSKNMITIFPPYCSMFLHATRYTSRGQICHNFEK